MSSATADCVLDASALLALIGREPGADMVKELLPNAVMSAVNYCEVVSKLVTRNLPLDVVHADLTALRFQIHVFDKEQGFLAGSLIAKTLRHGLSLGDRACLALAISRALPIVTAERNWEHLDLNLRIKTIR